MSHDLGSSAAILRNNLILLSTIYTCISSDNYSEELPCQKCSLSVVGVGDEFVPMLPVSSGESCDVRSSAAEGLPLSACDVGVCSSVVSVY